MLSIPEADDMVIPINFKIAFTTRHHLLRDCDPSPECLAQKNSGSRVILLWLNWYPFAIDRLSFNYGDHSFAFGDESECD